MTDPTPEAIEAAARVLCRDNMKPGSDRDWETIEKDSWLYYADLAKEVLQAAGRIAGPGEVVVPRELREAAQGLIDSARPCPGCPPEAENYIFSMVALGKLGDVLAAAEGGKEAGDD